jgi:hypothetical protein
LVALASGLAGAAVAETVSWEAVALVGPGRQSIGSGVKDYSPAKDVVIQERVGESGERWWNKSLDLSESFTLSANVHRVRSLDGFGLRVSRRGDRSGFSWEWFDRQKDGTYLRRQGPGRLSVKLKKGQNYEELEAIEFLDDAALRYLDDMSKPPGTHTHEVLVLKGSVLRVVP